MKDTGDLGKSLVGEDFRGDMEKALGGHEDLRGRTR